MGRAEILEGSIASIEANGDNGTDWYKWLFTQAPDVRAYFVGAKDIQPEKVKQSERFQKQGTRFLTKLHEMAKAADNEAELRRICFELADGHKRYKIYDAAIYEALGNILMGFLGSKVTLTNEQTEEWKHLLGIMVEEAKRALPPK